MDEEMILKIRERETLDIVKYIAIGYLIFLFFYALILDYKETILQATFIAVFAVVIDVLNRDELVINEKGIRTRTAGFIKFSQIYRLEMNNRIFIIYTRKSSRQTKIIFDRNEDFKQIEKAYKFMDSKVRRIEEDKKDHEEYVKKYFE